MNLVERLRRRAEELEALAGATVPTDTLTLSWRLEAKAAMAKAAQDNEAAASTIERLQKEIETAREALEPFVRQMEREFPDQWPDAMDVRSLNESRWHLKVGDFRRAREAYLALKDKEVTG